jgi:hypothetical protein
MIVVCILEMAEVCFKEIPLDLKQYHLLLILRDNFRLMLGGCIIKWLLILKYILNAFIIRLLLKLLIVMLYIYFILWRIICISLILMSLPLYGGFPRTSELFIDILYINSRTVLWVQSKAIITFIFSIWVYCFLYLLKSCLH